MDYIKQNVTTWFGKGDNDLLDFYQNEFRGNTTNGFKAPRAMVRRYNNFATQDDIYKAINAIGEIYIQGITHLKYEQLKVTPFAMLEEDTKDSLKQAVCEAIQFAMYNEQVYERVNSSTISTNNFTMNKDTTSWMLTMDMYGKMAWNLIQNSGIDEYHWVVEDVLFADTLNGNVKLLGKGDLVNLQFEKVQVI